MKKLITLGILVGSLFATGCQSAQENDNYNELYGYPNQEGLYRCVYCDNYAISLNYDNPYEEGTVPLDINGVYAEHIASAYSYASQVWESTKCLECSVATLVSKTDHPDFHQDNYSSKSLEEALTHIENCSFKHNELAYSPSNEVLFECISCGNIHTEAESYYNEDGMSVCSESCFNQVGN